MKGGLKPRELTFIIVSLVLAAVLGGLLGEVIGGFLPDGVAKTVLSKSIEVGFNTVHFDFYALAFSIGLTVKLNFMSLLTTLLVVIYFKWWYL